MYEVLGYETQEDFDNRKFRVITNGRLVFDAFMAAGVALKEDYQIVKVQSDDREDITILRRD